MVEFSHHILFSIHLILNSKAINVDSQSDHFPSLEIISKSFAPRAAITYFKNHWANFEIYTSI